jgi:hypothetical protein
MTMIRLGDESFSSAVAAAWESILFVQEENDDKILMEWNPYSSIQLARSTLRLGKRT